MYLDIDFGFSSCISYVMQLDVMDTHFTRIPDILAVAVFLGESSAANI